MSTPIPSFATNSPYVVTRKTTAGEWVNGRWVESTDLKVFNITGSVQRLNPQETLLLPEAFRTKKSYRVYTESTLRAANESLGLEADQIEICGEMYTILSVEYWFQLMPHTKAIAVINERNAA